MIISLNSKRLEIESAETLFHQANAIVKLDGTVVQSAINSLDFPVNHSKDHPFFKILSRWWNDKSLSSVHAEYCDVLVRDGSVYRSNVYDDMIITEKCDSERYCSAYFGDLLFTFLAPKDEGTYGTEELKVNSPSQTVDGFIYGDVDEEYLCEKVLELVQTYEGRRG